MHCFSNNASLFQRPYQVICNTYYKSYQRHILQRATNTNTSVQRLCGLLVPDVLSQSIIWATHTRTAADAMTFTHTSPVLGSIKSLHLRAARQYSSPRKYHQTKPNFSKPSVLEIATCRRSSTCEYLLIQMNSVHLRSYRHYKCTLELTHRTWSAAEVCIHQWCSQHSWTYRQQ